MPRQKITKIRDKFWQEHRPNFDLDLLELYVSSPEEMDRLLSSRVPAHLRHLSSTEQILRVRKKIDKLLYKVYRAASICLTDKQWRIFVLRYKFGLTQVQVAEQIGCIQQYVQLVLTKIHEKLQIALRLRPKKKRARRRLKNHLTPTQ